MLNPQQKKAIESQADRIIIEASAGTGKTHVAIAAAETNKFGSTVLITFTNKAADEMKTRLSYKPAHVGTIHSFAYRELLKLAKQYKFRVRLLRHTTIKKIIQLIFDEHDFGIYPSPVVLSEAFQAITNDETEFNQRKTKIYKKVKEEYQKYKDQQQLFDMTDTPKYLLNKLKHYNIVLDYDLVLVDEAQDLDETQYELVQLLGHRTIVIGDPRQSIYMFRGATSEIFNRFILAGYELHTLETNYRSKQEVIDNAGVDLNCERGTGGEVLNDTRILQYGPTILCRTNYEVDTIMKYYPSVMTVHAAKGLEFNNVCVIDFNTDDEESENIMFVALTRAKDRVGVIKFSEALDYLYKY